MNPDYYKSNGKDLFTRFEEGLLTTEEYRGFLKGNIFKYVTRYQDKNGQEDLVKAETYMDTLEEFEKRRWLNVKEKHTLE